MKAGWQQVNFGDVVRLNSDRIADPLAAGVERYVGIEHIEPEDLRIRSWGFVAEGTTFTNAFQPGQVLFVKRRAYQRKVAVADFSGVCSGDIYVLESQDPTVLLPELLPFICQTERFFNHAVHTSAGSLSPRTNWKQLANYEFALPPLEEQRRIAEMLGSIETLLVEVVNAENELETLRKSYIVDIFGKLIADRRTKTVRVAQAGEVQMGRQRSPRYEEGIAPRPYLRVANVYDGKFDLTDVKQMDFVGSEFDQYRLKPGDVLLVEGHSSADVVGRSAIFRGEVPDCCFQNTLLRFRPYSVSSEFTHQYFRFCLYTGRFSKVAKQTTIAHLSSSRFSSMQFLLVSQEQDEQIVSGIRAVEDNLVSLVLRKSNAIEMKRRAFDTLLVPESGTWR